MKPSPWGCRGLNEEPSGLDAYPTVDVVYVFENIQQSPKAEFLVLSSMSNLFGSHTIAQCLTCLKMFSDIDQVHSVLMGDLKSM